MVKRIFVEKKENFRVEAQGVFNELKDNIGINSIKQVRIFNRYDVDKVEEETYERAVTGIFSEVPLDDVFRENLPTEIIDNGKNRYIFPVEYLPGQYDQRADSAAQCIKLLNPKLNPTVKFARIVYIEGELTQEEKKAVLQFLVNPVDSKEASMEKPESIETETEAPEPVKVYEGFIKKNKDELEIFRRQEGFAMSQGDVLHIHEYFANEEKRDPTETELKVIDTYWSDHCRHTTFNTQLSAIFFDESSYGQLVQGAFNEYLELRKEVYGDRKKDVCLMDMATIGAKYLKKNGIVTDIDESEEINACSIKAKVEIDGKEEDWLVMFKNETHNHPTEIEPFGGAATCLGGAIRDPLSGRAYVYQAMRVTGAADPRQKVSETIPGKLPQRKITKEAARGYSSYGNQIGLATGQVDEIYHPGYVAKRMEVGAVVGAAPAENVVRERPLPGDLVVLVGGKTGRDGIGGATGSSKEHTEGSILECSAEVQKGNPPVERNIQRMFRRKEVATLIKRCNDFGAGGVSVAIGELADGLEINLDLVPKKYHGLNGTELAISESQERMAVVIEEKNREIFLNFAHEENLEATVVAKVTDKNRVVMSWNGEKILNISRDFLETNGAAQTAKVKIKQQEGYGNLNRAMTMEETIEDLNCCSKKGLIECFDSTIGAGTVLMPLGGKYQLSPAMGMAAKLPITKGETNTATVMAYGYDPYLSSGSPFHGAYYAVVESITKLVAMGCDYKDTRLSFQEYFEKLGTDEEKWGKPMGALLGALKVQKELGAPAIGGKDSMSGTFKDISVPPALISFAVAMAKADEIVSTEFKKTGDHIVMVSPRMIKDGLIDLEEFKEILAKVRMLVQEKKILAASSVGQGGVFAAIVKMAVGNKIGAAITGISYDKLTTATYGSLILEISGKENLEEIFGSVAYVPLGSTTETESIKVSQGAKENKFTLNEIIKKWTAPLENIFPTKTEEDGFKIGERKEISVVDLEIATKERLEKAAKEHEGKSKESKVLGATIKVAKPKIIIPTFPGTNCEMDSKRAFERAGGIGQIEIINNLTEDSLNRSIESLRKQIMDSQIIMLPGGFSGGDEPDGSAKFITAIFNNPYIEEAVTDLLENRGGLILGVCNGFQALVKLGLLPEGKIGKQRPNSLTLTYNQIGRHVSTLVRTKIVSNESPWLQKTQVGEIHTIPVSHGEGQFVADKEILQELIKNGQVATQYVDFQGKPSMDIRFNPNNSVMAIEGITSKDGRVFGKMGHSERVGNNIYKNVIGAKDQKIFESGVEFFK